MSVFLYLCDTRNENDIDHVFHKTLHTFGSIDGVVLNTGLLCLNNTLKQSVKEVDLMTGVNIMIFLFGQNALKNMDKGHMIIVAAYRHVV